ncbi:hypothetical protein [Deinococcus sp. QL22]|uniref:hypothetical protein n=1 Tax=Deinococcus sp. QL22 TaxID=2939437 RepID=UPI002016B59D|nr:hypothetical protein [Deinococcus sp. QL22]UQN09005.1 hypothetical protein M1R55_20685 [Deinococcus sp. QL22]
MSVEAHRGRQACRSCPVFLALDGQRVRRCNACGNYVFQQPSERAQHRRYFRILDAVDTGFCTAAEAGIALLTACPPAFVPFAYAAAEAAVKQGRPPGEVLSNLLKYLAQHPMPNEDVAWAVLAASL